jgi:3-dehydroquinate dehydratase/shikimate dehydrogenase
VNRHARLCVTVTAATTAELRQRRDAVQDADLVELRLDSVVDPDVTGALAGREQAVVITCRPVWEGGQFKGSEEERRRILGAALAAGAEYVDIEWRARFDDLVSQTEGRRVVLSSHDFEGVPADLADRAREMRASGAEVIKLAVKANRLSDCIPLLELGATLKNQGSAVLIAMGERGLASRVLASRFGSAWTYAGAIADVGQIAASSLVDEYGFRHVGDSTEVYGVTGFPVSHSVSPAMHNAAFRATGRDAVYLPLPAADADDFAAFARSLSLAGASVTIPFKVPLLARVDDASDEARSVGALNTIRMAAGRWFGANTDVAGFLQPLRDRGIALSGMRAAILGAGGSARAVAVGLGSSGAELRVHARREGLAREVAQLGGGRAGSWPPEPGTWDLLVNCTPIGMYPNVDATPVAAKALTGGLVYDLVYNPTETRLLGDAAAAGCQTIGGLEMLVAQAEEQFRWWTGARPPAGVMRDAATRRLSEFAVHEDHVV